MFKRCARFLLVPGVMVAGCGPVRAGGMAEVTSVTTCRVTAESSTAFVPPAPYPAEPSTAYSHEFWHGTPKLWTILRTDGTWTALPHSEDGYSQKVFWWSEQYSVEEEPLPALTVTGRRLDGEAGSLVASEAMNATSDLGTSMLVGVTVPTEGCWEITGNYRGTELSFVVQVTP